MSFPDLIQFALDNAGASVLKFGPELALSVTIVTMLAVRLFDWGRFVPASGIAFVGSLVGLYLSAPWIHLEGTNAIHNEIFTGMLVYDKFTIFIRSLLMFFLVAFVVLTWLSGIPDREDGPDFYSLVLGGTVGMCLMASANHLLIVFLGVEMASVPSYALAGLLKGRRKSSEAALKYAVFGAGTAGVMLYGISLLCGVLGSAHMPTMATNLAEMLAAGIDTQRATVLALGGLMVMVGLAFKLSAVPFHFWCPDVFEGASAEVNAFLSVASKAAALALLIRVALGFSYAESAPAPAQLASAALYSVQDKAQPPSDDPPATEEDRSPTDDPVPPKEGSESTDEDPATEGPSASEPGPDEPSADGPPGGIPSAGAPPPEPGSPVDQIMRAETATGRSLDLVTIPSESRRRATAALGPVRTYIMGLIGVLAAVTCTFGNLAAYGQTNIKRLFAYSTIAHAGYLMMPVAAAVALVGQDRSQTFTLGGLGGDPVSATVAGDAAAVAAVAFYTGAYLFMNLGAFAIIAFLRNVMRSEEIADYAGLIRRCPGVVICFSIILLSLIGLPPLSGFAAKFWAFSALAMADLWGLLIIGGLNTALSLFYYLRVMKVMILDPEPEDRLPVNFPLLSRQGLYVAYMVAWVVVLGIWFNWLNEWSLIAAAQITS